MTLRNNLIIVAHLDDEIFGMGGLLHKMKRRGDQIVIFYVVTEGENEDRKEQTELILNKLNKDNENVHAVYVGLTNPQLDLLATSEIISLLDKYKTILENDLKIKFTHCYTHDITSGNQHHQKVGNIAKTIARDIPNFITFIIPENEVRSLNFRPNLWESLNNNDIDFKKDAGFIYGVYKPFTLRSPEGIVKLAELEGLKTGTLFAESFCLERGLNV